MAANFAIDPGAIYLGEGRCRFRAWAPSVARLDLHILSPTDRVAAMEPMPRGYYQVVLEGTEPGTRYFYRLGNHERPDPASRYQPDGVHGPSQVMNSAFDWQDQNWFGLPLRDYVIYELHVGTFTPQGSFEAIIPRLHELRELGITAVEIMPVAQFPGTRNWGYDGVFPFAAQNSYGGPAGLKKFVDACHKIGLAAILDVVYNHLGPEGNYLAEFGPYFTRRYKTPWGPAINFDGPHSDEVRRFFIANALYWVTEFHFDALRLDAVHAILDHAPRTFLEEAADAIHERAKRLNRQIYVIAESAANDARLIRSRELGGYGLDAQWSDDFHHSLRVLLTGDQRGYYQDFGRIEHLVKAFREGFVYSGEYSPFRKRRHGSSSRDIPAERFVVFGQNHDQVGNRMRGERLSQLASFDALKLAACVVLLSPFIPLLFMGEEYGETAPFPYFISHSDPDLIDAVRRGRRQEFSSFQWQGELPDAQDEKTFYLAKLNPLLRHQEHHKLLNDFYGELIRLRREIPALAQLDKETMEVTGHELEKVLFVRRWSEGSEVLMVFGFHDTQVSLGSPVHAGRWQKRLDSTELRWQGNGISLPPEFDAAQEISLSVKPQTAALFERKTEQGS